jgi:hypothetical protein
VKEAAGEAKVVEGGGTRERTAGEIQLPPHRRPPRSTVEQQTWQSFYCRNELLGLDRKPHKRENKQQIKNQQWRK